MSGIRELFEILFSSKKDSQALLVPHARGLMGKHIRDDDRARNAENLATQQELAAVQMMEEIEQLTTALRDMNRRRDATKNEVRQLLDNLHALHNNLLESWVAYRLKLAEMINIDEWEHIVADAKTEAFEAWQNRQKTIAGWNRKRELIEWKIQTTVKNPDRAAKGCAKVREVWVRLSDMHAAANLNPVTNENLKKHDADRADLRGTVEEITRLREFAYESYFESHFLMVELTTEAEWERLTGEDFY